MTEDDGQPLAGGWQTTVRRVGESVQRSPSPWSSSVLLLLRHLEAAGFASAPRPVGSGFDAAGNELLSFVPGESPQPFPWGDDAIVAIGRMLAELHRAAADFTPGETARWKDWFGRRLGDSTLGFGHGDLGPWNIMAIDGVPTGFIDWDTMSGVATNGYPFAWGMAWRVRSAAWMLRNRAALEAAIGAT